MFDYFYYGAREYIYSECDKNNFSTERHNSILKLISSMYKNKVMYFTTPY